MPDMTQSGSERGTWLLPEVGVAALGSPWASAVEEYRVISGRGTDLVWEFRGTPEEFDQVKRALRAAEAAIEEDA